MRAVQFATFGPPDVLQMVDVHEPHATGSQVRIAVRAAGVNPVDWKIRGGTSRRAVPVALPSIPGMDAAGIVDEIGDGVTGIRLGDEVFGPTVTGAYAQFAIMESVTVKPARMSWAEVAALPSAVETATRALDELGVRPGDTLLISGAAGGVGSAAVQLAVHRGAHVIGTASPENQEYLRQLGAEPTSYGDGLVDRVTVLAPAGVDRALDVAGHGVLPALIALTGSPHRVLTLIDPAAEALGVAFSTGANGRAFAGLQTAADLYVQGRFVIELQSFALDDAAAAHRLSETGHSRGRIVLTLMP